MAASAYYDKTMTKVQLMALLQQIGGKKNASRSKPGTYVYSIDGGGEAMVENSDGGQTFRVRLYKGKCPC